VLVGAVRELRERTQFLLRIKGFGSGLGCWFDRKTPGGDLFGGFGPLAKAAKFTVGAMPVAFAGGELPLDAGEDVASGGFDLECGSKSPGFALAHHVLV